VPVGLAESLKVRTITKEDPFRTFVLKFLQKKMHSHLKHHSVFKLIGSPTGGEDSLRDYLVQQLDFKAFDHTENVYLSGDYKAATDNIKSWASNVVCETLSDIWKLDSQMRKLFRESLTEHEIVFKEEKIKVIEKGGKVVGIKKIPGDYRPQRRGQLMGSITSFPVLCIINAAISRFAYELQHGKTLLKDIPMCINGDDIAMKTSWETVRNWRTVVKLVGLSESIGKSYYSTEFVQINSRNFINCKGNLHPVKFFKMGLIYGTKRSGTTIGLTDLNLMEKTLGTRYRDLMDQSPKEHLEKIHERFIEKHAHLLKKYNLPWYIPEWLGGWGLTGFREPSEKDLRIAQMIIFGWKQKHPTNMASLREITWKTWSIAEKFIPYFTVPDENEGSDEYLETMKFQCIDLLFNSNYSLSDLFLGQLDEYRQANLHRVFEKIIRKKRKILEALEIS